MKQRERESKTRQQTTKYRGLLTCTFIFLNSSMEDMMMLLSSLLIVFVYEL